MSQIICITISVSNELISKEKKIQGSIKSIKKTEWMIHTYIIIKYHIQVITTGRIWNGRYVSEYFRHYDYLFKVLVQCV